VNGDCGFGYRPRIVDCKTGASGFNSRDRNMPVMIEFPQGEEQKICVICREEFEEYAENLRKKPNLVCRQCDQKAVNRYGEDATAGPHDGQGDNPVFIDGHKCWRRYRFGSFFTHKDSYDCDSYDEFYDLHYD
jgi:hypothetical protein